ncbi:hypothetical protein AVEN_13237-1 [Araneus ventricosus]|uniref:Uncharacterized protein n=1 Tax=Araneus ventricosus TaxID=182803 RepID=A0A4Y2DMC6_ARAVE|nr:hypothetical protein AVEN_13237-1 [Araneus ventricosus]
MSDVEKKNAPDQHIWRTIGGIGSRTDDHPLPKRRYRHQATSASLLAESKLNTELIYNLEFRCNLSPNISILRGLLSRGAPVAWLAHTLPTVTNTCRLLWLLATGCHVGVTPVLV